jgi:hypothetical protein
MEMAVKLKKMASEVKLVFLKENARNKAKCRTKAIPLQKKKMKPI